VCSSIGFVICNQGKNDVFASAIGDAVVDEKKAPLNLKEHHLINSYLRWRAVRSCVFRKFVLK